MLRLYGLLEFNVEIFFPHDLNSLPRGYDKHKSKLGDEPHIMTSKSLLVEVCIFSILSTHVPFLTVNMFFVCYMLFVYLVAFTTNYQFIGARQP
jgi:hypothetical protein